jgi:putative peptidoglycan lipid II flippase
VMLVVVLVRRGHFAFDALLVRRLVLLLGASLAMGVVLLLGADLLEPWLVDRSSWIAGLALLALCVLGLAAYSLFVIASGAVDARRYLGVILARRRGAPPPEV